MITVCCVLDIFSEMCDFEATDLCGFLQREDDAFDWTRGSASDGNGLLNDHTTGDYMGEKMLCKDLVFSLV